MEKNDLEIAIAAFSTSTLIMSQADLLRVYEYAGADRQKEVIAALDFECVTVGQFATLWQAARGDEVRMMLATACTVPIPRDVFRTIEEHGGDEALDALRRTQPRVVRTPEA